MTEPIEGLYFNWLRAKVVDLETPHYLYLDLMKILYEKEFIWTVLGDKNREQDGKELRRDFLRESGFENENAWFHMPCSVLEVLIAFTYRAEFQTDVPAREWFFTFLHNLQLDEFRTVSKLDVSKIDQILNTWIWRTYDRYGYGGLFPLNESKQDQRLLEIWYQFYEYLEDQGLY